MSQVEDIRAEVEVACADLGAALDELGRLGFRIETISPADDPAIAVISGHGVRLRLVRGTPAGVLRLVCRDPGLVARGALAGGIRIDVVADDAAPVIPPLRPSFVVTRDDPAAWRVGRAGMLYRDLIPDRQGGRFIASHIRIPDGGPVPDYVHYHRIRFQMIYCYKGWVRLVYEDQGEPFTMHAGDCVLQPPQIRHRVLACSAGLEVIEIGCPAVHETCADHELTLPTARRERDFDGQRFVWHRGEAGDLGIAAATGGIASARVCTAGRPRGRHDGELLFGFVLEGTPTLSYEGAAHALAAADAFVVPAGHDLALEGSPPLRWLEVTVPRVAG